MTTRKKWACWSSVFIAGLLSSLLSFFGLFGLAWGGFLDNGHPAWMAAVFFPYACALPLFFVAAAVSRLALYALWATVPFPLLAAVATSIPDLKQGQIGFLGSVLICAAWSVPLAFLAALAQYGTHFYQITDDRQWLKWKEVKDELAA